MKEYLLHIGLYDFFLTGLVFTGLAFAGLLFFLKRTGHSANGWLILVLLFTCLWLIQVLGQDVGLVHYFATWNRLPLRYSLALGPLMYFYVRQTVHPDYKIGPKSWLHFSPLLAETAAQMAGISQHPVFALVTACSVGFYLFHSFRVINRYYDLLKFNEGDRPRHHFKWLQTTLTGFKWLLLLSLATWSADCVYYDYQLPDRIYGLFYLLLGIMVIRLAVLAIVRRVESGVQETPSPVKPVLQTELKQKAAWLKEVMRAGGYHEDPDLTLNTLAGKLNLTSHELSRIINQGIKKSFNDFVNEYRVADVIRKLQQAEFDRLNLMGIAYDSGFNSKSTFHRVFKQMTGRSPSEFKSQHQKELPNYKLRPGAAPEAIILRHKAIPKWAGETSNRHFMLRNYLKIAFRNFYSNKLSTLINVVSLSVGTTAALIIYLIVHYDLSFDRFHPNRDRIYRVVTNFTSSGQSSYNAGVSGAAIELLKDRVSGVEASARLFTLYQPNVSIPSEASQTLLKAQDNVILTDDGYFRLFAYRWLAGSAGHALSQPNLVVLTAGQAKKYFPSLSFNEMLGRTVMYDSLRVTVSGVVDDIKQNTDLTFHDFISFPTIALTPALKTQVLINSFQGVTPEQQLFVLLPEGSSATHIASQLNQLYKRTYPPSPKEGVKQAIDLQPLSDLHFNANYGTYGNGRIANTTTLYELSAIGLFLLLLGCINFINLVTAQSIKRAKEIGIRKTMGSSRGQLIAQFILETFMVTFIAVLLSAVLSPFLLKYFRAFIPAGITTGLLLQPGILLFLLLLAIVVALVAGFYPAMILSSYNPVIVLKGQVKIEHGQSHATRLRKSLTVAQFVIAQFFIMGTVLVSKQVYYALHKDLGFKKEAILIINSPWKDRQQGKVKVFMDKLRTIPQVEQVSAGRDAPMSDDPHFASATYIDGKKEVKVDQIGEKFGDQNYLNVYHIQLLAGRNLAPQDTVNTVLINQSLARSFGFHDPREAVGKSIAGFSGKPQTQIIGVVADFHQESIHAPIIPLLLFTSTNLYFNGTFHIALKPNAAGNWESGISNIEAAWKEVYPGEEFSYKFFDENIAQLYTNEQNTSKLLDWATGLSILISCLGLLGLTMHTANQRKKEIGIRKVMGASVGQMVVLLSSELAMLIVLAFFIASPLAWLAMKKWIEGFADRTPMSWWIFVASGAGMFFLAMLTSASQTIKAALINPVKSIREQ